MKQKRILGATLVAATLLSVTATSFAALNEVSARQIAEKQVPAGAVYIAAKDDGPEYEVEFQIATERFTVEINKQTEAVTEIKTKVLDNPGSRIVKLSEADAQNIVRSEFPDAAIHSVKLETDQVYKKFEVTFTAAGIRSGEIEINPETGLIIERDLDY